MATEKTLKVRVLMKTDTTTNWSKATNFIPKAGELIVYSDDARKIKVGDGTTNVNNLKFVNQDELAKITTLGNELLAVKNGYLPLSGGTITGVFNIKNGTRFSEMHFAPSFDSSYAGAISYDAGDTNKYGSSTRFFIRQYSITTGSTSSSGMTNYESFWFPSTASGLTTSVEYTIFTTKNPPTASQVGALPLTGGTLTGSLTVNNNIYSKGTLVSQTNNYPELIINNASGTTLAELFANTTSGAYSDIVLKVYNNTSSASYFTFKKGGVFDIPYSFSTIMGEFKSNAYPQLFFRNGNGDALAQLVVPTDNGSYNGLAVNVYSGTNTLKQYLFNSTGVFSAPSGITTTGNYISIKNNSYPQLTFSNANGTDIGKVFVSTTDGSYASTKIRAYSSASSYYDFQFVGNGTFNCATLVPTNALGIAYGGTGATTASGALSNLGALPKSGGTMTGALIGTTISADYINAGGDELVQLWQNDSKNSGVIGIGNTNFGDWRVITVSDDGRLLVDYTNPIYALGSSVIYSSTQPSSASKGMIWLKPVS